MHKVPGVQVIGKVILSVEGEVEVEVEVEKGEGKENFDTTT